jgi:hypothetical protein
MSCINSGEMYRIARSSPVTKNVRRTRVRSACTYSFQKNWSDEKIRRKNLSCFSTSMAMRGPGSECERVERRLKSIINYNGEYKERSCYMCDVSDRVAESIGGSQLGMWIHYMETQISRNSVCFASL